MKEFTWPEILAAVDHTQLKAAASWEQIRILCEEASEFGTASVCLPPSYVARARAAFPSLKICTVIGFPLGYQTTAVKVFEAERAIEDGADEIDMVINLGDVKNREMERVTEEIRRVKAVCGFRILKVIVEACELEEEEKIALCHCVAEGGGDYIKTSTGFGKGGAVLTDVQLFARCIGCGVKIKAAGGIRKKEELAAFLAAGCSRLGTSSAVALYRQEAAGITQKA